MSLVGWAKHNAGAIIIGLSVLLIVGFLVYWFLKPGAYTCGTGTKPDDQCGTGACIPICPAGPESRSYYDCSTRECICNPGLGRVLCGDICCPKSEAQQIDPNTCVCCPKAQTCGTQCCPAGQVCSSDGKTCTTACGFNDWSQPHVCSSTQTCITISDIPASQLSEFQPNPPDPNIAVSVDPATGTGTAYICHDPSSCQSTNQEFAPAGVENFYPCLNFTETDETSPLGGIGFCYTDSTDGTTIIQCSGKGQADCSSPCSWVNAFADAQTNGMASLNGKMEKMAGGHGDWCYVSTASRVVGVNLDPQQCTWKDCWAKMAQDGVIDIAYDEASGRCLAIQDCTNRMKGPQSSAADPSIFNPITSTGNLFIPDCATSSPSSCDNTFGHCPTALCLAAPNAYSCEPDGRILATGKEWACPTDPATTKCVQGQPGSGRFDTEAECMASNLCPCPDGYIKGYQIGPSVPDVHACYRVRPADSKMPDQAVCSSEYLGCGSADLSVLGPMCDSDKTGYGCGQSNTPYHDCFEGAGCDGQCEDRYCCQAGIADIRPFIPLGAYYCAGQVGGLGDILNTSWQQCKDTSSGYTPGMGCSSPHYHNHDWSTGFWKVNSCNNACFPGSAQKQCSSTVSHYCY